MDIEKQIQYWLTTAEMDLETSHNIFQSGKDYHYCLFVSHLILEKTLKAIVIKSTKDFPPKTHNLVRLAELAQLQLTSEQVEFLQEVNQFALQTRYPDYQLEFYNRCTKQFTEKYFNKIQDFYSWLRSQV